MHGTKLKYTRRVQVYDTEVNEKYYKTIFWYDPDAWYSYRPGKPIGKYQQELFVFTDYKGRLIGDGDVYFTGVDGDRYENEAPLKI